VDVAPRRRRALPELACAARRRRYVFTPQAGAPPRPDRRGRHVMRLTQAGDGVYGGTRWSSRRSGRCGPTTAPPSSRRARAVERPGRRCARSSRRRCRARRPRSAGSSPGQVAVDAGGRRLDAARPALHPAPGAPPRGRDAGDRRVRAKYLSPSKLDAEVGRRARGAVAATHAEQNAITVRCG
jgi:hypothetical protein